MATLTVRSMDDRVYQGLKRVAAAHDRSMEAEAREILEEGIRRRERWIGAKLADLSGDAALATMDDPFVRSLDLPRDVPL